ncbi:beta strand repeat-containing protein [Anatilimnocola floriformis]|uniref:beta strand repeat-containing protein n=1 Tax=Anatilimnocola floriformis TaxID=2948575 RepID=UPI0020C45F9F|nr:Ig-like domain-containing protein [Anatilimnocola floriformis]
MKLRQPQRARSQSRSLTRQSRRRHFRASLEQLEDRSLMAAFTAGNLVIYRAGDGVAALSNAAVAAFLDEYTPTGTLVQSIALPTAPNGTQLAALASGSSTNDGMISRSADGQYIMFPGYNSVAGTGGVAASLPTVTQRVVGRIDSAGVMDTSTGLTTITNNIRSVTSTNGIDIWTGGSNTGVQYTTLGSTTSTVVSVSPQNNIRTVQIVNGQLMATTGSGSAFKIGNVGVGLPTTSGQTTTTLPNVPATGAINQFFMADLDPSIPGPDTLYYAEETLSGVSKYTLGSNGNWTFSGGITGTLNFYGITGIVSGSTVTLFATRIPTSMQTTPAAFSSLVDSSGYNGTLTGAFTTLASAPTNTAFRGIALAPVSAVANTAPVNTATGPRIATEDTPLAINMPSPISVADPDVGAVVTTTVSVPSATADGTFTANAGAGTAVVTILNGGRTAQFVGAPAQVNTALATLVFTPALDRNSIDPPATPVVVTVSTTDGIATDTDTFNINILEINDPPVAVADNLPAINEDSPVVVIPVANLLANDSKGAANEVNQTLTFTLITTGVVGGSVQQVGSNVEFTPTPNYNGPASFSYTITDNGTNAAIVNALSGTGTVSFTINPVNDAPSFTPGANQVRPFGTNTAQSVNPWATAISAGGGETQTLTFNVSNNNNAIFSTQPAISSTGVLTFTPTGVPGVATVTVVLQDNGGTANGGIDQTAPITFTITINTAGNAPTINAITPVTINEDAGLTTVNFSGVTDGADGAQQAISISAISNNPGLIPNPTVTYTSPAATGSLSFTPVANASGTATITVTLVDSGIDLIPGTPDDLTTTTSFLVTVNPVNDAPTITNGNVNPFPAIEDDPPLSFTFTGITAGPGETQTLQVTATSSNPTLASPVVTYTSPSTTAGVAVTLAPNLSGTAIITVTVRDAGFDGVLNTADDATTSTTQTINVTPVNDRPTITTLGNQTVAFNSGAQSVAGFASVVSFGPPDEAGQAILNYIVNSNSNFGLFSVPPSIDATGRLTYTPATGQQGTATIMISGRDNGGVNNGGFDTSDLVSFTITVSPPSPNLPPTINPVNPLTINEDATLQTVSFSGVSGGADVPAQNVTVTATSDNTAVIPNPTVNYTTGAASGSLTFTPVANANGTATISVVVRDSGLDLIPGNSDDSSVTTTFVVTVNAVNDVPSFTITSTHTSNEDAGAQTAAGFATNLSTGPANESAQTLTFNVLTNSNPSLFAVAPAISPTGTLTYTAAPNAFGSATITVVVQDNGGLANGGVDTSAAQTFTITVAPVNDAPTFAIGPNRTVPNTAGPQTFAGQATTIVAGPANEAGQAVTLSVTGNSNPAIFSVAPSIAANGTLTFTPAPGASGTSTITIVAQDNGGTANGGVELSIPQTFTITVQNDNPPTINPVNDVSVNENAGPQMVSLTGITAGGEIQAISVTAVSSNPALIANPSISYTSPSSTGTLVYSSTPGQTGSATITITVRDAGFDGILNTADDKTTTEPFTVTVVAVNDPPVANDQTLPAVLNTPVSGVLTASDPDSPTLIYGISMNPNLGTITSFNAATGAFTYTPLPGATGLDLFTFSVSDGELSDTGIVRIAIQGAQPVVTPSNGDLLVIGTPNPDMIIISYASAGVVLVRTDAGSGLYPVTGRLIVNSGEGNDYVIATGVLVPTTIDLAEGDDYASSGMQDDLIIGGAGNDKINASGGNNVIWGDTLGEQDLPTGGADVLSSLGGNDIIYGGGANDQIFSGAGDDYINAGMGDDTVSAGAGNDRVFGNGGNDGLYGDEGDDVISGGAGADTLVGRTGDDILIGGTGGDTINGDDGRDLLFAGNTTNSASSTAGDANDLALISMLLSWTTSHPSGLASSLTTGNDGAADSLLGYTGDDDFYANTGDALSDFNLPYMGTDRLFTA